MLKSKFKYTLARRCGETAVVLLNLPQNRHATHKGGMPV
jgi:hypothetical protein